MISNNYFTKPYIKRIGLKWYLFPWKRELYLQQEVLKETLEREENKGKIGVCSCIIKAKIKGFKTAALPKGPRQKRQ
jgi:hypothetical protein